MEAKLQKDFILPERYWTIDGITSGFNFKRRLDHGMDRGEEEYCGEDRVWSPSRIPRNFFIFKQLLKESSAKGLFVNQYGAFGILIILAEVFIFK